MAATRQRERRWRKQELPEVVTHQCIRRWKRDGSVNRMGLSAAVGNIGQNNRLPESMDWITRGRLIAGEKIETRLAEFHYVGDY